MWKIILYFSFIILFHVSLIATDEKKDDREIMHQLFVVMKECNETFKVDMAYLAAFGENGNFPDETDKIPKCFVRCLLMGINVITDDDQFNPTEAAIIYSATNKETDVKEVEEVATSCTVRNEKCKCERAYEFLKCLVTTMLEKTKKS